MEKVAILVVFKMKKLLFVFALSLFIACADGTTKRTRCKSDTSYDQGTLDPKLCSEFLIVSYNPNTKLSAEALQATRNIILLMCATYSTRMYKCEKKSNILPP